MNKQIAQGMVEYALVIALIAIVVVVALFVMGPQIARIYSTINTALAGTPHP